MAKRYLTSNQGAPVVDDQHSLTVGERGPILLVDTIYMKKFPNSTGREFLKEFCMRKEPALLAILYLINHSLH